MFFLLVYYVAQELLLPTTNQLLQHVLEISYMPHATCNSNYCGQITNNMMRGADLAKVVVMEMVVVHCMLYVVPV